MCGEVDGGVDRGITLEEVGSEAVRASFQGHLVPWLETRLQCSGGARDT